MQILTRLDGAVYIALGHALDASWRLENFADLRELLRRSHSEPCDAVVLDPLDSQLGDPEGANTLAIFRRIYRALHVPLVLLTPASYTALGMVVDFARVGPFSVLLMLGSGEIEGTVEVLERAAAAKTSIRILRLLQHSMADSLSTATETLVEHLFHRPCDFRHAERTVRSLGGSCALLNADLHRAGLASFHELRRIARVSHARQLLVAFKCSLKNVVPLVGAGSIDSLIRECRRLTGFTPSQMARRLSEEEFIEVALRAARAAGRTVRVRMTG